MLCTALAIGLHLGTYHFDASKGYNDFNPGAYVVCDGWTSGAYRNSERKPSVYAGKTFAFSGFDVTIGAVTGYRRAALTPMLVPSHKFENGVRLSLLLPAEKGGGGVHLSWEF
jgi:hypothetical protein